MPKAVQNTLPDFPTTILLIIFELLCKPVLLPLQTERTDPRLTLSLVCVQWANIIRSTLSLWNDIHFSAPPAGTTAHPPYPLLHQFAFFTRRCRPNSVSLSFDKVSNGWSFSIIDSVIITYIRRIKSLSCLIYGNLQILQFLTIAGQQFSALESLNIDFVNTWDQPVSLFALTLHRRFCTFQIAPLLRSVVLRLYNGLHPLDIPLPFVQLTTLDLGAMAMPPDVCVKILDSTSFQLESGVFYIRCYNPLHPQSSICSYTITMRALQTLRLRLAFPSTDTRLFSLLRFPSLQRLCIELHDVYQDWDLPMYTKLLRASTKPLRQLFLYDMNDPGFGMVQQSHVDGGYESIRRHRATSHHTLEEFFKVIRNVESLHLPIGVHVHTRTLEKLATCELLPRLFALDLGALNGWQVVSMVSRRRAHALNTPLRPPSTSRARKTAFSRCVRHYLRTPPRSITYIHMLVPSHGCSEDEKRNLVAAAQALETEVGRIGIICDVQTTEVLPLPFNASAT